MNNTYSCDNWNVSVLEVTGAVFDLSKSLIVLLVTTRKLFSLRPAIFPLLLFTNLGHLHICSKEI